MVVNVVAGVGFGVKIPSKINWNDPKFNDLKQYVWDNADENAHNYYENLDSMFDEDNFDFESFFEPFLELVYCWTGNPYSQSRKNDQVFVFVEDTYVKLDDAPEFKDLTNRRHVSPKALGELEMLKLLVEEQDQTPRWYLWSSIS